MGTAYHRKNGSFSRNPRSPLNNEITTKYERNKNITFAWKSATAVHPHLIYRPRNKAIPIRARYSTETRTRKIYKLQKAMMEFLNIPFLDLYEATYLSADESSDSRHYSPGFNQVMWNWFFN